jgi:hypothetical protein
MLEPSNRLQLVGELRPPEGFEFDAGVGTTFSLDLISLLTVPLSLALCEFESPQAALESREAILEGLRRVSGKLHVFCHRGRIKLPRDGLTLFSFLEEMVAGILPPRKKGAFHPKVWVLRYRRGQDSILRVLVLSRNLTFDNSWDVALVLEGSLQLDRLGTVQRNARLAQFLRALPPLSGSGTVRTTEAVESLAQDVSRTQFEAPADFEDLAFWPLGIGSTEPRHLFTGGHSRFLVVSPFVSDLVAGQRKCALDQLLYKRTPVARNVLVSRPDQLDALPLDSLAKLQATTDIFYIEDSAAHGGRVDPGGEERAPDAPREAMSGLHAKVYIVEDGTQVRIFAGSANATAAGWGRNTNAANVEFMVELRGPRSRVGIDKLLGNEAASERGDAGFRALLKPYHAPLQPVAVDADQQRVEVLIDDTRAALAAAAMSVQIEAQADDGFRATLLADAIDSNDGVVVHTWPIMLPSGRAQVFGPSPDNVAVEFHPLAITALTPFWAFRITARVGRVEQSAEFVLDLPVEGMPAGRTAALMAKMIDSSERFLRYLAMLLADDPLLPGAEGGRGRPRTGAAGDRGAATWGSAMVFENLVRAFGRNPQRLERIDALLEDLGKGGVGVDVIPADFLQLWDAFRSEKK